MSPIATIGANIPIKIARIVVRCYFSRFVMLYRAGSQTVRSIKPEVDLGPANFEGFINRLEDQVDLQQVRTRLECCLQVSEANQAPLQSLKEPPYGS